MTTIRTQNNRAAMNNRWWPFKSWGTSPLAWWRLLPSDRFRDAEKLLVRATLDDMVVLCAVNPLARALRGDAAAAIATAFSLLPVDAPSLEADIAMTAVVRCALDGNAAAALALANILARTDIGHPLAAELSASWLRPHDAAPRIGVFSVEEAALLEAIEDSYVATATWRRA